MRSASQEVMSTILSNVLRMKKDEELWISDKEKEYHCVIESTEEDEVPASYPLCTGAGL